MPADRSSDFEARPISEEILPQNQETLQHIASFIRLAETFRVVFVKCNQPVQCRQMAARLKEMLRGEADIVDVHLREPVSSLRRSVVASPELSKQEAQAKRAIQVFGFERSIPSEGPAPALDELNQSRENFPKSFSGPFLIWLPDYALTRLAREAPDFWGWRSGVFEFSPESWMISVLQDMVFRDAGSSNLALEDKRKRAEALEGLVRDYLELQRGEREDRALAAVLFSLGNIRDLLGESKQAFKSLQQSLEIAQRIDDKNVVGKSLVGLGNVCISSGDYRTAILFYEKALTVQREIKNKNGEGIALMNLGNAYLRLGDYRKAIQFYEMALAIQRDVEDHTGESYSLGNLGNAYLRLGDSRRAIQFYEQALAFQRGMGDMIGEGRSLGNLGNACILIKDYPKAIQLYEQGLIIQRNIGDRNGEGTTLIGLGSAYLNLGDYHKAIQFLEQSLTIQRTIGDRLGEAASLTYLSISLGLLGDRAQAIEYANSALKIFEEIESPNAAEVRKILLELKK